MINDAIIGTIIGWLAMGVFVALLIWYLIRYFTEAFGHEYLGKRAAYSERAGWLRVLGLVIAAFVLSRLLMYGGGALMAWKNGELANYFYNPTWYWTHWDGHHYIGLIENWYVNEGDSRFHIVFFPLYPAIGRAIHLLTGLSATAVAYLVSNAAFIAAGVLMYRVAEMGQGGAGALRATLLFMFSPLTVFCSAPYTESVFILATLAGVYMARRRHFFWAVLFGALSANARMCGMATAIPIFYEMLSALKRRGVKDIALCVAKVLPVSLGLLAYIWLNWNVTGDPFRFLQYQSEHWSQNFGSLVNTIEYTFANALEYHLFSYRIGVWIPQIIAIFAALILFCLVLRRAHPGDAGYALVYYYASVAPTWLLSGPRYLTAMYAAYPMLALITRRGWVFAVVFSVMAALCAVAGAMYLVMGCIL